MSQTSGTRLWGVLGMIETELSIGAEPTEKTFTNRVS